MSIDDGSACSGDMYVGVPTIAPVSARLWSVRLNSVALATPKSMTLGVGPAVDLGDHHVGRLEVAVDDPLLVGVLHRLADRARTAPAGPRPAAGAGRSTR